MNVLFILCDTLVRDKLEPYHGGTGPYGHIRTPNLRRLGITFTNHWLNSAPCMPARRDLWSGRIEFPWRSWGPRESFDPDWTLALRTTDVTTALITDHANLFDVGAGNYHHWFDHYEFIRGHYNDHCATVPKEAHPNPRHPRAIYQAGRETWRDETDTFCARTLRTAAEWLDRHGADEAPWFLMIDEFDPHWPLDPPEPYRSLYLDDPSLAEKGLTTFYKGNDSEDYTPDEVAWIQAQAAGKITLLDRWLGEVFEAMDRNGLWDDTLVILTTDHGEFTGEHGQMSKGACFNYPLFSRIPLLVHCPASRLTGTSVPALTCAVDLHATVLDALGVRPSPHCHGRSLLPLLRGEGEESPRRDVLYGWWGKAFHWTDGDLLLCKAPVADGPLYQYGTDLGEKYTGLAGDYFDRYAGAETGRFLPHTDRPVYRVPADGMSYTAPGSDRDALFDLTADPQCRENLYTADPPRRDACLARMVAAMRALQVPEEHFVRLGLETR
jgi:arylsulfatase A-like enzyme